MAAGEGTNALSMREKALLMQHLNKQQATVQVDYLPESDMDVQKVGLGGWKGLLFYAFVIVLSTLALINLIAIVIVLTALRLGYGMESLEFISPGKLLRFLNHADMGIVIPITGIICGFSGRDLPIVGDNQPVIFHINSPLGSSESGSVLKIHRDFTLMSGFDEFRVVSPLTGKDIFSTYYKKFKLPTGVSHLNVKEAHVSRIVSKKNEPLEISSPYQVMLKGNEGLTMSSKEITWSTGLDLYLKSVNQSIILEGKDSIMISVDKLPFAAETQENAPRWYKLCVCMPGGKVFRIPVRENGYGCQDVRFPESINPCT